MAFLLAAAPARAKLGHNTCLAASYLDFLWTNFFTRLEFQNESKKDSTQRYHGSGRPHVHALFCLRSLEAAKLQEVAVATLDWPEEHSDLAAYVRGSQLHAGGNSRWPTHTDAWQFDAASQDLRLHHSGEDSVQGVRGYFPAVLNALRCHQNLQLAQGRGLLLSYVTSM